MITLSKVFKLMSLMNRIVKLTDGMASSPSSKTATAVNPGGRGWSPSSNIFNLPKKQILETYNPTINTANQQKNVVKLRMPSTSLLKMVHFRFSTFILVSYSIRIWKYKTAIFILSFLYSTVHYCEYIIQLWIYYIP